MPLSGPIKGDCALPSAPSSGMPLVSVRLATAMSWSRRLCNWLAMVARSLLVSVPLPALTMSWRASCTRPMASPMVDSAWAIALRWFSRARCSVWMRLMRVSARSAWAADTGSSLARTTRLPEVRFSCRLTSDVCRADTLRMELSYMLAVPTRKIVLLMSDSFGVHQRRPHRPRFWISVSKTLCAICSILADAW